MLHEIDKLEGSKIYLEYFSESCIKDEYISWLNDPEIVRFSNQRYSNHTVDTSLQYLSSFRDTDNLFLAIRMIDTAKLVGTINAYVDLRHGVADMGIMIGDREQWGNGIGLDSWSTLMQYLFDGANLRKVTGGTLRPNEGMVQVMLRSGMHLEAVREKHSMLEDVPTDIVLYSKFHAEEMNS